MKTETPKELKSHCAWRAMLYERLPKNKRPRRRYSRNSTHSMKRRISSFSGDKSHDYS